MKKTLLIAVGLASTLLSTAQIVNIPDANFKTYLIGNSAINTNSDAEIQVTEAVAFTGNIFGTNLGITDLTGIEAFTSITGLYCRDNNLGTLDISSNTALTYVDCQNTGISTFNINSNTALTGFNCAMNSINSLDVSNNVSLTAIACSNNNISSLDLTNNPLLSNFSCDNNDLTSLNLSNNTDLSYFVCHFNELTTIDVSNNTSLSYFSCSGNDLTSLDVSNNTVLSSLYCAVNSIVDLDVSANASLVLLRCDDNNLSTLNVANGNNINFNMFNASTNPNLTCIQVDDAAWSTTNWTSIDIGASFSEDCNFSVGVQEEIIDEKVSIYPNPTTSYFEINTDLNINSISIVDASGKTINTNSTPNSIIDISNFLSGVYFLKINTDKGIIIKKVIKE